MSRISIILFILMTVLSGFSASAQVCIVNVTEPPPFTVQYGAFLLPVAWPQAGYLSVPIEYILFAGITQGVDGTYYYTNFTTQQSDGIETAIINWENSSSINNSLLTWDFYGTSGPPINPLGGEPYSPWHQFKAVKQADMDKPTELGDTLAEFYNYSGNSPGFFRVGKAVTRMVNTLTTRAGWVAAHEIGHTMALDDCKYCTAGPGGTVMSYVNTTMAGPTYCDNLQSHNTAYP